MHESPETEEEEHADGKQLCAGRGRPTARERLGAGSAGARWLRRRAEDLRAVPGRPPPPWGLVRKADSQAPPAPAKAEAPARGPATCLNKPLGIVMRVPVDNP